MNKKIMKVRLLKTLNLFKRKLFIPFKIKRSDKRLKDLMKKSSKSRSKLLLNLSPINNMQSRKIKQKMLDKTRFLMSSQTTLKKVSQKIKT